MLASGAVLCAEKSQEPAASHTAQGGSWTISEKATLKLWIPMPLGRSNLRLFRVTTHASIDDAIQKEAGGMRCYGGSHSRGYRGLANKRKRVS